MAQSQVNITNVRQGMRNPLDAPISAIANRIGGEKAKEVERFIKFAVVGITGAIVDFGILIILQATVLPPTTAFNAGLLSPDFQNIMPAIGDLNTQMHFNVALATSIAFIAAVVNNFIWTSIWVYPDSQSNSKLRQLMQFTLISATGGIARAAWVTTMTFTLGEILMPIALPIIHIVQSNYMANSQSEAQLGSIVAQLIGMAVVMLWNFFANRYWTYNDV